MFRSFLLTVLAITTALAAYAQMKPETASSSPDSRVGKVIEVTEAGRATERCVILQVWKTADGTNAMLVRSHASGELITIVEHVNAGVVDRFRTYRWGQSKTSPLGAPSPPPADALKGSGLLIMPPSALPPQATSGMPVILPTAQLPATARLAATDAGHVTAAQAVTPRAVEASAAAARGALPPSVTPPAPETSPPPLLLPPARNLPRVADAPATLISPTPPSLPAIPKPETSTPALPTTLTGHMKPTLPMPPLEAPLTTQGQLPAVAMPHTASSPIVQTSHQAAPAVRPASTPATPAVSPAPTQVLTQPSTAAKPPRQCPAAHVVTDTQGAVVQASKPVLPMTSQTATAPLQPPADPTPSVGILSGDKVGDVIPLVIDGKRDTYRVLKRQRGPNGLPMLVVQSTTTQEVVTIHQDLSQEVRTEVVSSVLLPPAQPSPPLSVPPTNLTTGETWKPTPPLVPPAKPTASLPTTPATSSQVSQVEVRLPLKPVEGSSPTTQGTPVVQADHRQPSRPSIVAPNNVPAPAKPSPVQQASHEVPPMPEAPPLKPIDKPTPATKPSAVVQADHRQPAKPSIVAPNNVPAPAKPSPVQQASHEVPPMPEAPPLKPIDKPTPATKPSAVVQADHRQPAKPSIVAPNNVPAPAKPSPVQQASHEVPPMPEAPPLKPIDKPTPATKPSAVVQADHRQPAKPPTQMPSITPPAKPNDMLQTSHGTPTTPSATPEKPLAKPILPDMPPDVPDVPATPFVPPSKPALPEAQPAVQPVTSEKPQRAEDVDFRRSWEDTATSRHQGRVPAVPADTVIPAQYQKPAAHGTLPPVNDPLLNPENYVRRNPAREMIGEVGPTAVPSPRHVPPQRPLPPLPAINGAMGSTTATTNVPRELPVPQPHVPLVTNEVRPPLPPPQPPINRYDTQTAVHSRDPYHPLNAGMVAPPLVQGVQGPISPTAWTRGPLPPAPQSPVPPPHTAPRNPDELQAVILRNTLFLVSVLQSSGVPAQREWAAARLEVVDPAAHPFAVEALVTAAKTDPMPAVRARAIRTLSLMGAHTPSVLALFRQAARDADPRIREQAVEALQLFGVPINSGVVPAIHETRGR